MTEVKMPEPAIMLPEGKWRFEVVGPINETISRVPVYTEAQLRDYGDRRVAAMVGIVQVKYPQLLAERDALRAEVERLKKQVIRAANFELDLLRALDGQVTLCGFEEIAEVEKLKADNLDLRSDESLNEAEAEIARLKNNLANATNILQSVLNGKTSPQLAQVVVNTLNEVLDAARGIGT